MRPGSLSSLFLAFAILINEQKLPGVGAALKYAVKIFAVLLLARGYKLPGHPFAASVLADFAYGLTLGPAFSLYTPSGKMEDFADGFFAAIFVAVIAFVLSFVMSRDLSNAIMCVMAAPLVFGKIEKLALAADGYTRHLRIQSITRRLLVFLPALAVTGSLFLQILPYFQLSSATITDRLLSLVLGALLCFL